MENVHRLVRLPASDSRGRKRIFLSARGSFALHGHSGGHKRAGAYAGSAARRADVRFTVE